MADLLLGEVDEALRWDRIGRFWKQWRKPILYAAFGLVVVTAASSIWQGRAHAHAQAAMEQFTIARAAYAKGDYTTAYNTFHALAGQAGGELNDLARLWEARTLEAQKKPAEAAAVLASLAEHPKGDDLIWRDLACLRLAGGGGIPWPQACSDAGASPLKPQRDEFRAARLVEEGKIAEARAVLTSIVTNDGAASTARARAQSLLAALTEEKAK